MQETTEDDEGGSFARNADQFLFSLQSLSSVCLQGRAAGIKPSVDLVASGASEGQRVSEPDKNQITCSNQINSTIGCDMFTRPGIIEKPGLHVSVQLSDFFWRTLYERLREKNKSN